MLEHVKKKHARSLVLAYGLYNAGAKMELLKKTSALMPKDRNLQIS